MLYGLLGKSTFVPLLRSCAFLIIRLHSGSREADITTETACLLESHAEVVFARTTHAILQRIRVLTLSERTSKHADEIDLTQAEITCSEVSLLLQILRIGLIAGRYSASDIAACLIDRAPSQEDDETLGVPTSSENETHALKLDRAAEFFHALDAPSLLLELLLIPIPTSTLLTPAGVVSTITESAISSSASRRDISGSFRCFSSLFELLRVAVTCCCCRFPTCSSRHDEAQLRFTEITV